MSRKYKFRDDSKLYFVTFTVINWIDLFIRNEYKDIFLSSVRYCQNHKDLEVYGWFAAADDEPRSYDSWY